MSRILALWSAAATAVDARSQTARVTRSLRCMAFAPRLRGRAASFYGMVRGSALAARLNRWGQPPIFLFHSCCLFSPALRLALSAKAPPPPCTWDRGGWPAPRTAPEEEPMPTRGTGEELPTVDHTALTGAEGAAPVRPPEELPARLGRYRVTGLLGTGGFGVVYKGHDDELQRDVAIKVSHSRHVTSRDDADAYLAEARILASLDHPGIVAV